MVARRLLVAAVPVAVALASIGTSAGAPGSDPPSTSVYRLRGDPRMCPSPTCGGFWASRVNFKPTTCLGGTALPAECYAASIDLAALAPASRLEHARRRVGGNSRGGQVQAPLERLPPARHARRDPCVDRRRRRQQRGHRLSRRRHRHPLHQSAVFLAAGDGRQQHTVTHALRARPRPHGSDTRNDGRAREAAAHGGVFVSGTIRAVANPGPEGPARTLAATQVWLSA